MALLWGDNTSSGPKIIWVWDLCIRLNVMARMAQEIGWVGHLVNGRSLVRFPGSPGYVSVSLSKILNSKFLLKSRLAICRQYMCEQVNVTSVVKHFELWVDWKSAIERQIHSSFTTSAALSQACCLYVVSTLGQFWWEFGEPWVQQPSQTTHLVNYRPCLAPIIIICIMIHVCSCVILMQCPFNWA